MNNKLAGVQVRTADAGCTGHHTDGFGIGATSISLHRPDGSWVDLLEIWFQDMDQELFDELTLDKATSPTKLFAEGAWDPFSGKGKALSDAHRRLSQRQAFWLREQLTGFIASLGVIPSDEELKAHVKHQRVRDGDDHV